MKILFFGKLAEMAGASAVETSAPDLEQLRAALVSSYPFLQKEQFQVAVNGAKVTGNMRLNVTDEVALLPAFAGG